MAAAALEFSVGDEVTVVGLVAKPQHNGKRGVVVGFQRFWGSARVQVHLQDQDGSEMALKPANLVICADGYDTQSSDEDGVIGFHITESGEREVTRYSSRAERSWVELFELVEHKLWAEAESRIDGNALSNASLLTLAEHACEPTRMQVCDFSAVDSDVSLFILTLALAVMDIVLNKLSLSLSQFQR